MSPAWVAVILGCQAGMMEKGPRVQKTVIMAVRPSQGSEHHGRTRAPGEGAEATVIEPKITASTPSHTSVTFSGRVAAKTGFSSESICTMKKTELASVSSSQIG